jgi:hypothetical protein
MEVTQPNSVAPSGTTVVGQSPRPSSETSRALQLIIKSSYAVSPPAMWAPFGSIESVRRLSCRPEELLAQMTQGLTADELLASGVAERTKTGDLEIAVRLDFRRAFLVRREQPGGPAVDVVTQRGKLGTKHPEWRDLAERTKEEFRGDQLPVVLCGDGAEQYVLSRFKIPCTPLAGIAKLTAADVHALFMNRIPFGQQRLHRLVLPCWNMKTLTAEPSAKNLAAIRHVANIAPVYGKDPHEIFDVWFPSPKELTRIRRAISFADAKRVAAELKASLSSSVYSPAVALTILADRAPALWSDARAALESVIEDSQLVPRAAAASAELEKLEQAYRKQVLRPLEAAAGQTGLPALRSLAAAVLAKQWFENLESVRAARRIIEGRFPGYTKHRDDESFNRNLKIVSALIKLERGKV